MKKKRLLLVLVSLAMVGCNSNTNNQNNLPNKNPDKVDNIVLFDDAGTLMDTTSVKVHYARNDGNYKNWGIWTWQHLPKDGNGKMLMFTESDGVYGNYTTIDLVNDATYVGATEIGFICKTHDASASPTTWTAGKTDISSDRFIQVPAQAPNGVYDIYLYEGVSDVMTSLDQALKDKIISSDFTNKSEISTALILSSSVSEITESMFHVYEDGIEVNLKSFNYANKKVTATLAKPADITKNYSIKIDFPSGALTMSVGISCFYDDADFKNNYTYYGNDLGVTFNSDHTKTTFKVWAPVSSQVVLNLYDSGTSSDYSSVVEGEEKNNICDFPTRRLAMKKEQQGVWSITVPVNLHGRYYTYSVTNGSSTNEVVDPYARSCGIDGNRGQVVDFDKIDEEIGWNEVKRPDTIKDATDASIYEVHVRDATIDPSSGFDEANRGNFLGLAQKNTKYTGKNGKTVSTGLAHIKELGVTHVQLQPVYDYNSVDESLETKYNWGYDPENYNCLEGSYSSNPYNGLVRVKEYKEMIKSFSEEGILVNMDVVYNHTAGSADTNFDKILPGYYHRMNKDGSYSNGSGCGNEMASERPMYRKFVIDSCKFWVEEYNVSGFRFDLMALLDTTTMEKVYTECAKLYDKVMVYGEPWTGGTSLNTYVQSNQSTIQNIKGVGAFNDHFRDGMRGDNNLSKGWIQGNTTTDSVIQGIWGQFSMNLTNPLKTVNYVSCHDNYTLFDQIDRSNGASVPMTNKIKQVEQAQAMVFLAEGISFIHGGEEMLRTKAAGVGDQVHNSYNAGDKVNRFDYERKTQYTDVFEFMKKVVAARNDFKGFRLTSYQEISSAMKFNSTVGGLLDYQITCDGCTYRVATCNSGSHTISGLSGYTLVASNANKSILGNSVSVGPNEIVVLKK